MDRPAGGLATALAGLARAVAFAGLFYVLLGLLQFAAGPWLRGLSGPASFLQTGLAALAAVIAGIVLLRGLDGRPAGALGIAWTSRTPIEVAAGLAIGVAAIGATAAALWIGGLLYWEPEAGTLASWVQVVSRDFAIFAVAAFAEEAMFRGYGFQALVRGIGALPATMLASGLFALAHAQNPHVGTFALINIFLAGVLLSAAYLRTLSLWFATAVHLGWNWGMASLLDLPVSGIAMFETPLYDAVVGGPVWVSGGEFGPEAGVAGTFAFLAALVVIMRFRFEVPAQQRAYRPLVVDRNGSWGTG